jgi:hypothetical protein
MTNALSQSEWLAREKFAVNKGSFGCFAVGAYGGFEEW